MVFGAYDLARPVCGGSSGGVDGGLLEGSGDVPVGVFVFPGEGFKGFGGVKRAVVACFAGHLDCFFCECLFLEAFSLDGLGLLGYEAALTRDYPVIFATLYFFSLLGLVMGILGDITYSIIDPRIDFESRGN